LSVILKTESLEFEHIKYPNIEIYENEANFLQGDSGSGKTTLFKLINCTLSPAYGNIYYKTKSILEYDTVLLRKEILLVSQSVFLFNSTVRDNFIQFYSYLDKHAPTDEHINKFLDICCINTSLDKNCDTMSGGERHRIYISICLSLASKIIMLDEPTSSLDSSTAFKVMGNILNFCKENNITPLVISHDKHLTDKFCTNFIYIGDKNNE
jgi:putative ABC transport system ATP-binding protein